MQSLKRPDGSTVLNLCACGKLQFNYGPITLHFEPNDFIAFASAVGHLLARYRQMQNAHPPNLVPSLRNDICH
jgi:hypothetical protein